MRRWPLTRRSVGTLVPVAVAIAALAAATLVVFRDRDQLSESIRRLGWPTVGLSFALAVAGVFFIALLWRAVLTGLGAPTEFRAACAMFFISQLGKYLPGSLWPVVSQMEFGRRHCIARRTMLAANVITLALSLTVALILAAALLPFSSPDALGRFWWTFLLLPPLVACVHPRALPAVLDALFRVFKREPLNQRVTGRSVVAAVSWSGLSWVVLGLHLYVITHALGAHGPAGLAAAIGGVTFGVAVGIVVIPAPAGIGVRDVALGAVLTPGLGATNAIAAALASRILLVGADVVLAVLSVLARAGFGPTPDTESIPGPRGVHETEL
ncbi:MAG: lysylphosphatidylglycerol synthase domain-containing protein [Jatrophihabitantaceae bacterium]